MYRVSIVSRLASAFTSRQQYLFRAGDESRFIFTFFSWSVFSRGPSGASSLDRLRWTFGITFCPDSTVPRAFPTTRFPSLSMLCDPHLHLAHTTRLKLFLRLKTRPGAHLSGIGIVPAAAELQDPNLAPHDAPS